MVTLQLCVTKHVEESRSRFLLETAGRIAISTTGTRMSAIPPLPKQHQHFHTCTQLHPFQYTTEMSRLPIYCWIEKYRAKVSDFGTSRSVTVDKTHLTTLVAGTFGYMDAEYLLSSQYTDKSDVYSFGVVLVETGETPLSLVRSEEGKSLATHFLEAMTENRVVDIIDDRIKDESKLDQVMAVATLAGKCLSRKGRKRPNMREVSLELERILRSSPEDLKVHFVNNEDDDEGCSSHTNQETHSHWGRCTSNVPASMLNASPNRWFLNGTWS